MSRALRDVAGDAALINRKALEDAILQHFPATVSRLSLDHYDLIGEYLDGTFGASFSSMMLYANGRNIHSANIQNPTGLIFHDGNNLFGIGIFRKPDDPAGPFHVHIVAPRGENAVATAIEFVRTTNTVLGQAVSTAYIRHLSAADWSLALSLDSRPICDDPWHAQANSEDETYNHRRVAFEDILETDGTIKILSGSDCRKHRKKARMAYNRFSNFLSNNGATLDFVPFERDKHLRTAIDLVETHFETLSGAIGSTPNDYYNLLEYFPLDTKHTATSRSFGVVGYLNVQDRSLSIPIVLFIGEKISSTCVALYATFSIRNRCLLPDYIDDTGFSAISQYAFLRVFQHLATQGVTHADLGGSETADLDNFKRQLGAKKDDTYWVVVS